MKTASTGSAIDTEIATVAYRLWLERGRPMGSDLEDWLHAEAMVKNELVVKREDLFRDPSTHWSDTGTESEMPAELASEAWQGHWEVWEREWVGARWVWDVRNSGVGVSNRARRSGRAA